MPSNSVKFSLLGMLGASITIFALYNLKKDYPDINKNIQGNKSCSDNQPTYSFYNSSFSIGPEANGSGIPKNFENQSDFMETPLIIEYLPYTYIVGQLSNEAEDAQEINYDEVSVKMKEGYEELGKRRLKICDVQIHILNSKWQDKVRKILQKGENERTPEDKQLLNTELCLKDVNPLYLAHSVLDKCLDTYLPQTEN